MALSRCRKTPRSLRRQQRLRGEREGHHYRSGCTDRAAAGHGARQRQQARSSGLGWCDWRVAKGMSHVPGRAAPPDGLPPGLAHPHAEVVARGPQLQRAVALALERGPVASRSAAAQVALGGLDDLPGVGKR
eukprot:CAMPEP_0202073530 /NCGR_PEP_ID=MMETSP0964-20121228/3093_1 /ASSEMBLY_ACC=CAM_ASM_000500 /TAXON_ID=4773 /ORGANISM="Schizochytrium aggregatum, Strain ATCC28209" /LENGTH=131 /DNA_ID=CAMNT_0048640633 /DNA_START=878 /DNA_END=1271 /DNA_ORIENTATION=+